MTVSHRHLPLILLLALPGFVSLRPVALGAQQWSVHDMNRPLPPVVDPGTQWRDPAPLATLRPDVPPAVEELVHHLLEKEPARRYEDARALAPVLETLRVEATAAPAPAGDSPNSPSPRWPLPHRW